MPRHGSPVGGRLARRPRHRPQQLAGVGDYVAEQHLVARADRRRRSLSGPDGQADGTGALQRRRGPAKRPPRAGPGTSPSPTDRAEPGVSDATGSIKRVGHASRSNRRRSEWRCHRA